MTKVQGFTWTVEDTNLITTTDIYGDVLVEIGRADPRIVCLTADLGNSTKMDRFKKEFPDRFFNVGIAEQNMVAVASGLAATGLIPVVSTYATFASLRAAEFVRNDLAYNNRNVKIIGTLAGVTFGQGGPTHHSLEDIALMRAIPRMVVMAPCDGFESGKAVEAALASDAPTYIRIGRGTEPMVHADQAFDFKIGKAVELKSGTDVTLIVCGASVYHALSAAERAADAGISVRVVNMHTLKPLDQDTIHRAILETRRIVTAEDHSVHGGLGSAVADVIAASGKGCFFKKLGHQDRFAGMGIPEDLAHQGGFDDDAILAAVADAMKVTVTSSDDWADEC